MSLFKKNADDLYRKAISYLDGKSSEGNTEKGFQLLVEAAEKGSADAAFRLALIYRDFKGGRFDLEVSQKWAEIAAKAGHVEAKVLYGESLWAEKKNQEAVAWLKSAYEEVKDPSNPHHEKHFGNVCWDLADIALEEKLLDECHFYANEAVESGCEGAKHLLALSILNDDKDRALKLIKESYDQEDPHGAVLYALSLIPSEDAFSNLPDYGKSVNYLIDYANNDENDKEIRGYACYAVGLYTAHCLYDMDKAYDWFKNGVSLGNMQCDELRQRIQFYNLFVAE